MFNTAPTMGAGPAAAELAEPDDDEPELASWTAGELEPASGPSPPAPVPAPPDPGPEPASPGADAVAAAASGNRVWNPNDGNIPWDQWRDYGCGGCDPSAAHYNHLHVSVHLRPGDPAWAECTHDRCSE